MEPSNKRAKQAWANMKGTRLGTLKLILDHFRTKLGCHTCFQFPRKAENSLIGQTKFRIYDVKLLYINTVFTENV